MENLFEDLKHYKTTKKGDQRMIAFIDLLGFTSALEDENNFEKLVDLIIYLTRNNKDFQVEDGKEENSYKIHPSITVISDSIVISYPLETLHRNFVLLELQKFIAFFALIALDFGFLIRGCITYGRLYHQNGIVIGNPLIEASKLEKRAVVPRILVTKILAEQYNLDKPPSVSVRGGAPIAVPECSILQPFKDDDTFSLRYISYMLRIGISPGSLYLKNVEERVEAIKKVIINNINTIKSDKRYKNEEDRSKILKKWNWYECYFKEESDLYLSLFLKSSNSKCIQNEE